MFFHVFDRGVGKKVQTLLSLPAIFLRFLNAVVFFLFGVGVALCICICTFRTGSRSFGFFGREIVRYLAHVVAGHVQLDQVRVEQQLFDLRLFPSVEPIARLGRVATRFL